MLKLSVSRSKLQTYHRPNIDLACNLVPFVQEQLTTGMPQDYLGNI